MKRTLSSARDEIEDGLAERAAEHRETASEVAKDVARAFGADPGAEQPDYYDERTNWGDWLDSQHDTWFEDDSDDYGLDAEDKSAAFDRYYYEIYLPVFGDDID